MLRLHVVPAQGQPFDHLLESDTLVIGRSSTSDLPLADRFLSRHHARLFRDGSQYLIEDLGSRNGTLLNGTQVQAPTAVGPGDVIRISSSVLSVLGDDGQPVVDDHFENSHTVFRSAKELLDLVQEPSRAPSTGENPQLERYAERLRLLNEVHHALGSALAFPELLQLILDRLFDHLKPEQAAIYLRGANGQLNRAASRSKGGGEPRLVASQHLAREVTEKGVAAIVLDAQSDVRFQSSMSLLAAGVRSLVAAPLLAEGQQPPLGMVLLTTNAAVRQFNEEDMELLVSLASVAGIRLRNVALAEEAAQRRVLEEELALARRIQGSLLPTQLPALPGFELCARNTASRHVSGDLYQAALRKDGGECVLLLADVAGKGMAASLLAASVEALSAGPIEDGLAPADVFARVSRLLFQRTPAEKYATAFLAAVDSSGRVEFANAGHNPGLVVRADGAVETLGPTGVPLGLFPATAYRAETVELAPGDALVLYTDGITEAANERDEELGIERLIAVCRDNRGKPPSALADAIDRAVADFVGDRPPGDDRTLLIACRVG